MDVVLLLVTGLGLRLFLDGLDDSLGRLTPVLLGLWEGAAVHHMSAGSSTLDHLLAYTLRIAIDLFFFANLSRTLIVLLFTILGLVISEYVNPTTRPRAHRIHRRRSSRTFVSTHIRHHAHEPHPTSTSPVIPPSQPPTPPSAFLAGGSEYTSPRSYADGDGDSFKSPAPKPVLLPTPPSTLASNAPDFRAIVERLSTIEELSSGEEGSRRSHSVNAPNVFATYNNAPQYTPSVATPLPVPNSTTRFLHTSISGPATPVRPSPSPSDALPLPVPNSSAKYYLSEDDGGDPLQTPPAAGAARWELVLTDDNDGLTTPPARELSPLVLERNLLPSFGQVSVLGEAPDSSLSANVTATEVAAAQQVPSAVEYSSTPVAPPHHDPDPATEPDIGREPGLDEHGSEGEPELVSSYPTPVPSPTLERSNHEQPAKHYDDPSPNGVSDEDAGKETETETDATSVVSSHPANVMWLRAEALRQEARAAENERFSLQEELKHAQGVKQLLFLKHRIWEEQERARKLHVKAEKRFFEARNALRKRKVHTIDVHGLRVAEAVARTEQALRDALDAHAPSLRVIVGKGLHSAGNIPVLKGTIIRVMGGYKVPCKVDPENAGVLILTLVDVH